MRYGIVSDIHSNRQALKAVMSDMMNHKVDRIISLGDLLGLGPSPNEVLETAYHNFDHFILGRYSAAICGKLPLKSLDDDEKMTVKWTRSVIDKSVHKFFKKMPYYFQGDSFRCAHSNFCNPKNFAPVRLPEEAMASFESVKEQILFVGNTHIQSLHVTGRSGRVHHLTPDQFGFDFTAEPEKRYIVNVGSVGAPTNNRVFASYAIFDMEDKNVFFRQIPFYIDGFIKDMKEADLEPSTLKFIQDYLGKR